MDVGGDVIQKQLSTLRIIVAALTVGVVVFTAVAIVVGPMGFEREPGLPGHTLALACAALMVMEAIAYPIIRGRIVAGISSQVDGPSEMTTLKAFSAVCVIGCAMAEGIALFGGMVVMIDGLGLNILLVAIPFAALIVQFPTTPRWESFLDKVRQAQVR